MELFDVFKIPENPKLRFGEPLDDIYRKGLLHGGLKDLFLKAYLSAKGDDFVDFGDKAYDNETRAVLLALKSGSNGQGSLHQRMSLKAKLEAGKWILAVQTPAGAPLWLLRHFLGRLPQPLLEGPHWKTLGEACGAPELVSPEEVLERISVSTKALSRTEFEVLALLVLLIKKLSLKNQHGAKEELYEDVLNVLSEYFIASIITRPYRPGLLTKLDRKCQPLLVFLSKNWRPIFLETSESWIFSNLSANKERNPMSVESHSYFRNNSFNPNHQEKAYNKFLGFESFLITRDIDQLKESSESLYFTEKNVFYDLRAIKNGSILSETNDERIFSELEVLEDSESETMPNTTLVPDSEYAQNDNMESNVMKGKSIPLKGTASTSALIFSKIKTSFDKLHKHNSDTRIDSERKLYKNPFRFNRVEKDNSTQFDSGKNVMESSSTECEFFSIPNSENSN